MLYLLVALVALVHQQGTHGIAITPIAGPWFAYTDKFYNCEGQFPWAWFLRTTPFNPQKPNELQLITGNVTGEKTIDDNFWVKVVMDTRAKNGWSDKGLTFEFKKKACSTVATNMPAFFALFFGKEKKPCTIDAGVYKANQDPIDWAFPKFPIIPYGNFRFKVMTGLGNDMAACLITEVHILPKPTK